MTTMIEKVAQAIADAQIGYERDRVSRGLASGKAAEHWEPATMRWDLMARAAIEAMMEPTVEMIDRGCVARHALARLHTRAMGKAGARVTAIRSPTMA